jgi:hypothetical protein
MYAFMQIARNQGTSFFVRSGDTVIPENGAFSEYMVWRHRQVEALRTVAAFPKGLLPVSIAFSKSYTTRWLAVSANDISQKT